MRKRTIRFALALFLCACCSAAPASAHLVQTGFGTLYDGIAHLVLTPGDLLVVLGLGLLAGLRGAATARALASALAGAWLCACLLGAMWPVAGELAWASALSVPLCGALVASNAELTRRPAALLAALVGALHGYANGATMRPFDALALLGALLAGFTLVTLSAALVVELRLGWQRIAVRVAGSWIAAIGFLLLGWQVRARS